LQMIECRQWGAEVLTVNILPQIEFELIIAEVRSAPMPDAFPNLHERAMLRVNEKRVQLASRSIYTSVARVKVVGEIGSRNRETTGGASVL
jgi:hypothetical protein